MILKIAGAVGAVALGAIAGHNQPLPETPFFCNLKALTAAERAEHLNLSERLAESVLRAEELPDGYAFELDHARVSLQDVAKWSYFERRCCPFFDFTLLLQREHGPLILRLTGRDGVKQFIRTEFPKSFRPPALF